MAIRENGARFVQGQSRLRVRALNDDLTSPSASNMIGGAGPFDFSGALAPAAVTGYIQRDDGSIEDFTIDLDDAGITITAVTVDQWVAAMIAGLAAASPAITGVTPSKASGTNRAKLVVAGGTYIQFWGEAATLAGFGQGAGLKAIFCNTVQDFTDSPTMKEDVTKEIQDANGGSTSVIVEGYKKGWSGTIVDTAEDYNLMALVDGGTIVAGAYTEPCSTSKKVYFEIESWNPIYGYGENFENAMIGWQYSKYLKCKGSVGENKRNADFATKTYNITGVNYKSAAGEESGAIIRQDIAVTAWSPEAFDAIYEAQVA